ncbi:MAG: DUF4019 domain-containing protein [Polaromonas sp.]
MKYTAFIAAAAAVAVAASVFCAALPAQERPADAASAPALPDSSPTLPAPATAPPPASAPAAPAPPLPSGPLSRAEMAATSWLAVVDAGDYPLSWRQAAGLLQTSVTQPKWESSLQTGRSPLGGVKSRTLKSATFSRTLTGAPDGEYVLIQYEAQFEFKALAVETLTVMKDKGNVWKVAGYFIK